ncbi:hypothetical protein C5F64_17175 [Photobacterium damselae subsp. damselae]|nr:hypothetical protein [Photobacterium damselae]MBE8127671.1 hypothetical protein [Photobacterium damselae subsp. piscicida]NVO58988.1 hypothetical protein [Photobacterium damselae subsp. damselae]PSB81615.1 hypothetical protein C5F64_17175 [Photobacterium damselae subsp. damselae]WIH21938.1 hypothetical protein KQY33_19875 [Photobacterium damselae]
MCKLVRLVAVAVALSGSQYTNASHTFTSEFHTISIEQIKPYVQNNGKVIRERSRGMNMMVGKWDLQYSSIHYNAPDSLLVSKANSNNLNRLVAHSGDIRTANMYRRHLMDLEYHLTLTCRNRWRGFHMSIDDFKSWPTYEDKAKSLAKVLPVREKRRMLVELEDTRNKFYRTCKLAMRDNNLVTIQAQNNRTNISSVEIEPTLTLEHLNGWQPRDAELANSGQFEGYKAIDLRDMVDIRIGENHLVDFVTKDQRVVYEYYTNPNQPNGYAIYVRSH